MGLDSVELVIAVEEEFDIEIPNAAACEMVTVGRMVDHVYASVNGVDQETADAEWAKMDAIYLEVIGKKVSDLPLDTKIVDLLDPKRECHQWEALEIRDLPARPARVTWAIVAVSSVAGLAAFLGLKPPSLIGFAGSLAACGFVYVLLLVATIRLREIPDRERKLGSEIWWRTRPADPQVPRDEIFERVKKCIVEQLAVEPDEVQEDSRFVEDLRMD